MKFVAGLRPSPDASVPSMLRRALPAVALFVSAALAGFVVAQGPPAEAGAPTLELAAVSAAAVVPLQPVEAPTPGDSADALAAALPDGIVEPEPEPAVEPEPEEEAWIVIEGSIPEGGTLASAMADQGVGAATVHVLATGMAPVFNFRYSRAGDRFRLAQAEDGTVLSFAYSRSPLERYHMELVDGEYRATRHEPQIVRTRARIAGVVSTSLYQAVDALGEHADLANDFANIFAWDVDFSRGAQPGDTFSMVYERLMIESEDGGEDTYVRPGRILAARYTSHGDEFRAVYFEKDESSGGYYRPDGTAVERHFLRAPLQFTRISSAFSLSRMHPILKIRRPHPGIDYAAPTGTPVWAVADGEVIHRGRAGGYGKLVKVRHRNGFVTYYGHLSRYAEGLRPGSRVGQKQVIGYVGSTGLATGPHLDFRIRKDGRFVNPNTLRTPAGDPIPTDIEPRFASLRDELLAELDPPTLVVVSEAL